MDEKRLALIVLGMHRSGTSALGGVLVWLGAGAPRTMLPPRQANPRGFFESAKLMKFHDRVLKAVGRAWDDCRDLELQSLPRPLGATMRGELLELIAHEYGGSELMMVKDPRLCRLLPLWLDVLPEAGIEPRVVLSVRHPLEVAASLHRRNGMERAHALCLWIRHVLDAERHSRGVTRTLVTYDDLLRDWRATAAHIASRLGVPLRLADGDASAEVDLFLSTDLRHNREPGTLASPGAIEEAAIELFELLRGNPEGALEGATSHLDGITAWLDAMPCPALSTVSPRGASARP